MRDLVEAAIGSHGPIETEPGEQGEETAFGDPTVALVGCGPAGRRRLDGARDAVPGVLQDAGGTDLERIAVTTGPLSAPDSEVDAVFDLVEGVEPTARRPPHLAGAERVRNNRERIEPLLDDVDVCLVTAGCSGMGPGLAGAMAEVAAETGTSAVTVPTVPADPSPRDRESLAWLTGTAGPTVPIHHALVGELAGCSRSAVDRHADERVVELAAAVHSLLTDSLLTCFDYTVFYEAVDAGGVAVPWVGSVPRAATGAQLRSRLTPLWHPPAGSAGEPAVEPPGETAWLGVTIAPTDIHLSTFDSLVAEVESVFGARLDDRSGELACFPDPEFEDSQRLLLLQFTPA